MIFALVAATHLGLIAVWLGSMLYSLLIVQPRATRFLGGDDGALEAFLTELGAGNRRPVIVLVAAALATGAALPFLREASTAHAVMYVGEAVCFVAAFAVFARVSWRLWPQRLFALPEERPRHRRAFYQHAATIVVLVAAAFALSAVNVALGAPPQ